MKKALVVGIDNYPNATLHGCINDATAFASLIETHGNGDPNFAVRLEKNVPSRSKLKGMISDLFSGHSDVALFYFSGHGYVDKMGSYLVTPDHARNDAGVSMDEILKLANESSDRAKLIILDCCHSGALGNPAHMGRDYAQIKEGVTILTSCRSTETSIEVKGHGVFTSLLLDALGGGAANIQGHITPGSVYAFIDQALGAWQQRPVFKANTTRFTVLRSVHPHAPQEILRKLTTYFESPEALHPLDPSYEFTNTPTVEHKVIAPFAKAENVAVLKELQLLTRAGLVVPVQAPHMYEAAMDSKACRLTALGQYYWRLAAARKL